MKQDRTRLMAGVAAALAAGAAGYGLARFTAPAAQAPPTAEAGVEQDTSGSVTITPETLASSGVAVETVRAGGLDSEILAQATVVAAPGGEALVTARAAGAVTQVKVRLGDPVRAGQVLAVVESREAAQIAADRAAAEARATLASRNLAREKSLFEQRVSARIDYETAQAEAAAAEAEARRARAAASGANVTADGRGVALASPISGRVTVARATLGDFVEPDAELFRVSDARRTQVEALLPGVDAARVQPGDRAAVELPDGQVVEATVRSVTPALDPQSRAATAVLDTGAARLQPGQTARARLFLGRGAASAAIVVPDEAVQAIDGRQVVFVRTRTGFRAAPVVKGASSGGRTEIAAGLSPGQQIATRNAFLLKAELGKGSEEEE